MGVLALLESSSEISAPPFPQFRQFSNFGNGVAEISEDDPKSAKTPILHTTINDDKGKCFISQWEWIYYSHQSTYFFNEEFSGFSLQKITKCPPLPGATCSKVLHFVFIKGPKMTHPRRACYISL